MNALKVVFEDEDNCYAQEMFFIKEASIEGENKYSFPMEELPHVALYLPVFSRVELFSLQSMERVIGSFDEDKGVFNYYLWFDSFIVSGQIKSTAFFNALFSEENIVENCKNWVKVKKNGLISIYSIRDWWIRKGTAEIIIRVFLFLVARESEFISINYNPKQHERV